MQFKLLQFYKVLSNFSTSLISAFLALLIYQQTGKIYLSVLVFILMTLSNLIFTLIFKKWLYEKAQICLLIRIVPIILMQVALTLLPKLPILAVVLCGIFTGINYALKYIPIDVIFTYATPPDASTKMLALTRFSEEVGYVLAGVLGGLFLDNLNYNIVICISLGLYVLSCLPLVVFYINNRKNKTFNSEYVSNAYLHFENKVQGGKGKRISLKLLLGYGIEYALVTGADVIYSIFGFLVYLKTGSFLLSGVLNACFDGLYALSTILVSKLDEKIDITILSSIITVLMGVMSIVLVLTAGSTLSYVLYELFAVMWPFQTIFINQRMLMKTKILGISNDANATKQYGVMVGDALYYLFGFISFATCGVASSIALILGGIIMPITEEKSRKDLVNYLEDNEI